VKALIKEKKEKENVLINSELMNLKNASLLQSKDCHDLSLGLATKAKAWKGAG
jgi:hypothetical protein